jgi:hypothetical protein
LLRALGAPPTAIPAEPVDRVRLYRSMLAQRRVLILLDDVTDAAQARPLLPGDPGCAVLLTSRLALTGLEGAHRVRLGALPPDDALALLAATAGPDRVAAEPAAAQLIIELCGRSPLALRVAGTKAAARPERTLTQLADRLADPRVRLDELRTGDLDVRAVLAPSVYALPTDLATAARRLALLGVGTFPVWTVTAVLGIPPTAVEELLDRLVDRQIVEFAGVDGAGQHRYRIPELYRLYLRFPDARRAASPLPTSA